MIYLFIGFCILFILSMFGMYLVKDYRDDVYYKGFIGKIQNLIKH